MSTLNIGLLVLVLASASAQAGHYVDDPCQMPPVSLKMQGLDGLLADRARLIDKGQLVDRSATQLYAGCHTDHAKGSDAELACADAGTVLNSNLAAYGRDVSDFNRELRRALTASEADLVKRMTATRLMLTHSRIDTDRAAARADEWIAMGESEARQARWTLFEEAFSFGLDAYVKAAHEEASLSQDQLQEFKRWYQDSWQAFPAPIRDQIERQITDLRTSADVVTLLKYIYEQHARAYEVAEALERDHLWEAAGKATMGALKLSLGFMKNVSPEATLTVATVEAAGTDIDAWHAFYIAKGSINQMLDMRDQDLKAIASLADSYSRDTARLKAIRAANLGCRAP